jgi:hypothetical protein
VRAERDVDDGRAVHGLDAVPVVAALGAGVLGVRGDLGRAGAVEADLDHLPVALVIADPGDALVVVEVEEPVLQPHPAGGRLLDGPAVHAIGEVGPAVHRLRVLRRPAGGADEVVGGGGANGARRGVGPAGQEAEVQPRHAGQRLGGGEQIARAVEQPGPVAVQRGVGHDRRRVGPIGLVLVVAQDRTMTLEEPGVQGLGGVHGRRPRLSGSAGASRWAR